MNFIGRGRATAAIAFGAIATALGADGIALG